MSPAPRVSHHPLMTIPPRAIAAILAATLCTGCFSTWDVPHHELKKLDGYRAPETVTLTDARGESFEFGPKTSIGVADDGRGRRVRVESAKVVDDTLVIRPAGRAASVVVLPAEGSGTVRMRQLDGTTTGVVIGVGGAAMLTVTVLIVLAVTSSASSSGGLSLAP